MLVAVAALAATAWLLAQTVDDKAAGSRWSTASDWSRSPRCRTPWSSSTAQRAYMSHEMRPLSPAKFAGPAVTVQLKKEEHKEGAAASQGMLDAIDSSPAGLGLRHGPRGRGATTPASAA